MTLSPVLEEELSAALGTGLTGPMARLNAALPEFETSGLMMAGCPLIIDARARTPVANPVTPLSRKNWAAP
jgi:hypothetical protein